MKIVKLSLFALVFSGLVTTAMQAQKFLPAAFTFSHKKTSYITLKDGTQLKGTIKNLDRKKGLIEEIKIVDLDGKKQKIKPDEVSHMYLPPSGWDKLNSAMDFASDAQKWNDDLDQEIFSKGYVYFEQADVHVKKKTMPLLMQLVNPSFSKHIKVYHDPYAKETSSFGVGGVTLAGGDEKSYYVKLGKDAAYRLKKKDYDEEFKMLYEGCPELLKEVGDKPKWTEFEEHVYKYAELCGEKS